MHGIASGNIKPTKGKPSVKVAREFVAADHKRGAKKLPQNVGGAIVRNKSVEEM